MIRLVEKSDIEELAVIYKNLYDNIDIGEEWTVEKAKELLLYWYEKQQDLFFVAVEDGKPVGAIMSAVKSWFDGPRLIDTEIFVSKKYQHKKLGRLLMGEHLRKAKLKYDAQKIEFHTYGDESGFPQIWYNRIGFHKDEELIIMNADIGDVLNKLGYTAKNILENTEMYNNEIQSVSYTDVAEHYNDLTSKDEVFIFDMLPSYTYVDNDNEIEYLENRISAMKNGANMNLFIVGTTERLNELCSNKLFQHTLKSCYGSSRIYVLKVEELKENCLEEYQQLGTGLYLGKNVNGNQEVFRDLWINDDNLGVLYRNKEIVSYMDSVISSIMNHIHVGDINDYYEEYKSKI